MREFDKLGICIIPLDDDSNFQMDFNVTCSKLCAKLIADKIITVIATEIYKRDQG